jgi:hypothetical protein
MFWLVLGISILFIFYAIYSLSAIKNQLKQISKHLNVKDDDIERVSNEEIEKELEENTKM